ncbi:translocation/assembly module TamB domain-containing protein [Halobacteriovorax sp. JY17]|uniref:translocation/assembly module TamB domain-containing protein n=1 Tax=Halobacteriovorax sp. JY17 TaxID=2014617 RepID=UPI0025BD127F|nr:translocation/assembly module TamB domain-containing protein [Halobacteriovorax sp. JY17]
MSTWKFVQSEYFGGIIANEINKSISSKLDLDLSFSNIEIEMFPPATKLKNVTIVSSRKEYEFDIRAGSLILTFGLSDFFGNKFSIKEISLVDADIDLSNLVLKEEGGVIKEQDYFPFIKELFQENLPFRIGGINLERSNISSSYIEGFFKKMNVTVYKSVVEANISGYGVSLNEKILKNKNINNLDYLSIEFHLNEKKLLLKKSEFWKQSQNIVLEGALLFNKELSFKGAGYFRGMLENLNFLEQYGFYREISPKGVVEIKTNIESNLSNKFKLDGSLRLVNLKSKYANLENLFSKFKIDDTEIFLEEAVAEDRGGKITLKNPTKVYDLKESEFIGEDVAFTFDNFHTNSLLYFLKDTLGILKGRLNGEVIGKWENEKLKFNIGEGSSLEKFTLESSSKTPILKNEKVSINGVSVNVDLEGLVDMNFDISTGSSSRIIGTGRVNRDKVDFKVEKSKVDFEEIGPISGLPLYGVGDFEMIIKGAGSDVNFDFGLDMSKVKILDFNITKLKGHLGLDLKELVLSVKGVTGEFKSTSYSSSGFIDFEKNKINLGIDIKKTELEDAIHILEPVTKDLNFLKSKYLSLGFKSRVKLSGGLSSDELRIYGIVDGRDLNIFKEKSESLLFNFDYVDNVLSFNEVKLRQSSSELMGQFKINTKSNYFEYDAKLVTGQLEDFEAYRVLNLGYSSEVSGEFYGKGTINDFSTRSHLKFTNSFLGNIQVPESLVTIYNNSKEVFSSGNFLGDRSSYNLYLNFDKNNPQKSYVNAFMNFENIKELVGVVSNHNMDNEVIAGSIKGSLKSSFSVYQLENLSIDVTLEDLIFKKEDEVLRINGDEARFSLKNGSVEKVNFNVVSNKGNFFKFFGKGNLSDGINIKQEFKLDSSFLELLSAKISKSSGAIFGEGSLSGSIDDLVFEHSFGGEDIFLNILGVLSSFSNVSFDLVFEQNSLMINKVNGLFGKGDVEARGFIKFLLPYPEIDLNLSFSNSYIPLFKKSGVLASGLAKIEGREFPYLLNGGITILNGTINDELQDLAPSGVSTGNVTTKYVPENKFDNKFDLFDLDLSVNFDKPIVVRNLLTDLRLLGNGRVRGKLYKPTVNGVVEVVPGLSKLLFKGNEFILKEGTIVFTEDKGLVPELNFTSSSVVNQYTVNLDVYGLANNPQLNISSDPFLNQEDIFSLLTLGFTSEVSDQLEEKERRSATTLGIGTLLFDQLLKNQGLSSNLGLKLSVLPEFEENESSLLKGKSGVSDNRSGRYKSATKIKLEKKLSRNVDLSLASTVGGSAEQKQEMNVNYNILKNVSLEGVYEINSTNEEQSKEPKSFGVDVKIQWTY